MHTNDHSHRSSVLYRTVSLCNFLFYYTVGNLHRLSHLSSDEPEKPLNLKNVLRVLQNKVSNAWEDIGIQLDIEDGELNKIKSDNPSDSKACLREMLRIWLKRVNPPPTWSEMVEALKFQGNEDIASQIETNYMYCCT